MSMHNTEHDYTDCKWWGETRCPTCDGKIAGCTHPVKDDTDTSCIGAECQFYKPPAEPEEEWLREKGKWQLTAKLEQFTYAGTPCGSYLGGGS